MSVSEETKRKKEAASRRAWKEMSPEQRAKIKEKMSQGMRDYWSALPREVKSAIAKKAAATRKKNRSLKGKVVKK